MYADDTVLFFSAKEVSDIERVLNTELELIHIWLQKNKLLLNIIKTEVDIFGTGPKLAQDYSSAKVRKWSGLLRRIRENLTANATNLIYKLFILPILDYCDSVWACCNRGDIDCVQRLQNRVAQIVMRSTRSAPALANLKWNSLEDR